LSRTAGFARLSFLLFCEEVFSRSEPDWRIPESVAALRGPVFGSNVTLANEADRPNILASGIWSGLAEPTFFPPSPPLRDDWPLGNRIQLQQRNCPGFTPDFSRRSTD
jgi:hypothetical protein